MVGAPAITSVTYLLTRLLEQRLVERGIASSLGDVLVSALPPDRVPTGAEERPQLNLFLYRLTPNTGYRVRPVTSNSDAAPPERPLALDLHYLLTAYGERNFQAERLIEFALQCLDQTPVISQGMIRAVLGLDSSATASASLPPALSGISAAEVADQVAQIRINAFTLGLEDLLKLWSSLQARFRLSLTYRASVALMGGAPLAQDVGGQTAREVAPAVGSAP